MGWRDKMITAAKTEIENKSLTQNTQNTQNESNQSVSAYSAYRSAKSKTNFPVNVEMESPILGATVDIQLWQDHATVEGVKYSQTELVDLLSRNLAADDLLTVHRVKMEFEGTVKP